MGKTSFSLLVFVELSTALVFLYMVPGGAVLVCDNTAFFTSVGESKSGDLSIFDRLSDKFKSNFLFSVPKVLAGDFLRFKLSSEAFIGFLLVTVDVLDKLLTESLDLERPTQLWMLVLLCTRLADVLGSLEVDKVDVILFLSSGVVVIFLTTLIFGLSLLFPVLGDNLQVILSLR